MNAKADSRSEFRPKRGQRSEFIDMGTKSEQPPHSPASKPTILPVLASPAWEPLFLVALAVITGIIAGFGAIIFRLMITWIKAGFHLWTPIGAIHPLVALSPAVGILLVGFISTYLAKEVKGHGVPQILEALALRGGRIRARVGILGVIAPAITIGSGGSVGREGPIALIGAAFGSTLGQFLKLSDKYISLLLAAGAAGGIAATFNAPIAGGFFGLEVVLGSYAMGAVVPVFISALIAVTVFTHFMGNAPVLAIPSTIGPKHPLEIFLMLGLGVLGGLAGVAYTKGLYFSEDLFHRWAAPWWLKNVTGGLAVGILGLFVPRILGVGYPTMHLAVTGGFVLGGFLLLLLAKYVATLLTIGAGGSGGVFAPSLYLGSMLGGVYGSVIQWLLPSLGTNPAAYAAVGMAAVFAGAAQAPFVAITIILEMTGDYRLTASVMAAAVISYILYGSLARDSMYTVRLTRQGIAILRGTDVRLEERIALKSILDRLPEHTLPPTTKVGEAIERLTVSTKGAMPVLDEDQTFLGVVTLTGLRAAQDDGSEKEEIRSFVSPVPTLYADDSLDLAMRRLAVYDLPYLAVLAQNGGFLGLLDSGDLVKAYNAQATRSLDLEQRRRPIPG